MLYDCFAYTVIYIFIAQNLLKNQVSYDYECILGICSLYVFQSALMLLFVDSYVPKFRRSLFYDLPGVCTCSLKAHTPIQTPALYNGLAMATDDNI